MMKLTNVLLGLILSTSLCAQDSLVVDYDNLIDEWKIYTDSLESTFVYERGSVTLKDGLATIEVPRGFKYLNGTSSDIVLTDIWGNPPREGDDRSLGMLIPEHYSPSADSGYAINITYSEDGYIEDEDAKELDYDDLLEQMQEDTEASNEYRLANGYERIDLVGWAAEPFYDATNKKLHWAKELKFGEYEENTLNYNIRILGRKGYLQLNAIGEMYMLDEVNRDIDDILTNVNFNEGNTYSDYDPSMDKVAAYGIGGLIAGKALAKVGILAKLGIFLAKGWKFILLALAGIGAGLKKYFSKPKADNNKQLPEENKEEE